MRWNLLKTVIFQPPDALDTVPFRLNYLHTKLGFLWEVMKVYAICADTLLPFSIETLYKKPQSYFISQLP
jgi:hypothetical protein